MSYHNRTVDPRRHAFQGARTILRVRELVGEREMREGSLKERQALYGRVGACQVRGQPFQGKRDDPSPEAVSDQVNAQSWRRFVNAGDERTKAARAHLTGALLHCPVAGDAQSFLSAGPQATEGVA